MVFTYTTNSKMVFFLVDGLWHCFNHITVNTIEEPKKTSVEFMANQCPHEVATSEAVRGGRTL